jgi:diguanylate cyclase (GGDEF)-like protein/PAS domain S-box-containing protein
MTALVNPPDPARVAAHGAQQPGPAAVASPWAATQLMTVLLIEHDPADARWIQDAFAASGEHSYRFEWVTRLGDGLRRLSNERVDLILLDLSLPDGRGLAAFEQICLAAPGSLILVLTNPANEDTARRAVEQGADDYLVKRHVEANWLPRLLRNVLRRKAVQDALTASEQRFRALSGLCPLGVVIAARSGAILFSNAAYRTLAGLGDATIDSDAAWTSALHPEDRQRALAQWRMAMLERQPFEMPLRLLRKDQAPVWVTVRAAPVNGRDERGECSDHCHVLLFETSADQTPAMSPRAQPRQAGLETNSAQVMLDSIGDAVLATDLEGRITYMNQVAEELTGWMQAEAAGRPLNEVFAPLDEASRQRLPCPVERALREGRVVGLTTDTLLRRRDDTEIPISDSVAPIHDFAGKIIGVIIVFHDVSEARARSQKMSHLAQHDFLTGLPNRLLLTDRLAQAIGFAHRQGKQVALMYLDLDFFKHINDTLGHAVGDRLLQSVAARLTACVRGTDTVCRQGGDEFVILLAEIDEPQDAAHVAEKLLASLTAPHLIDGHELHVTVSIGISIYPDDGNEVAAIMENADTAMYYAKEGGRNNYQFFRADMNTRAEQRMLVESSLRRALQHEEFVLHYQPEVDLASGAITGVEALLRWADPTFGIIYPEQFVKVAEECGLIVPLGEWTLHAACRQAQAWVAAGLLKVPMAVNVSSAQFKQKTFLPTVERILEETRLTPSYLELEVTESTLMANVERSTVVLKALKTLGVRLAIDDFGTGCSSLNYLQRLPIDTLKIDRSFLRSVPTDNDDAAIVTAVIGMGRNLKQRVVAEGVETSEQLDFLRARQCEGGQGFHFGQPLPAADFEPLLVEKSKPAS